MPSKETGTQWTLPTSRIFEEEPSEDSKELSQKFPDFWHSLPRTQHLRYQSKTRTREQRSQDYFNKTLGELVSFAEKTEQDEIQRQQLFEESEQLKGRVLDDARFKAKEFTQSKLQDYEVKDYIQTMPEKWAAERADIEADIKRKIEHRAVVKHLKPRSPRKVKKFPVENHWTNEFRNRLIQIQKDALKAKISVERKRELKLELDDMDMCHRPTHFLKTNLKDRMDPIAGAATVASMYDQVKQKVSKSAFDTLMEDEFDFASIFKDSGIFNFKPEDDNAQNEEESKENENERIHHAAKKTDEQFRSHGLGDLENLLDTDKWAKEIAAENAGPVETVDADNSKDS